MMCNFLCNICTFVMVNCNKIIHRLDLVLLNYPFVRFCSLEENLFLLDVYSMVYDRLLYTTHNLMNQLSSQRMGIPAGCNLASKGISFDFQQIFLQFNISLAATPFLMYPSLTVFCTIWKTQCRSMLLNIVQYISFRWGIE